MDHTRRRRGRCVDVQDPGLVLSSSQLNVLAVAVFLALNLAIPTLPLQVVALDDPCRAWTRSTCSDSRTCSEE